MILELAVGDAYGAGFEYTDHDFVTNHNTLSGYVPHPIFGIGHGVYTDDAQMTLAIAELLISNDPWTPLNLANKFVDVFKRDPREGYASKFYEFLQEVKSSEEFLRKINPNSEKSGGAMRASPLGFIPDMGELINYATIQAQITHNTSIGIDSSIAAALMVHYFIYNLGSKKNLGEFIESYVPGEWSKPWSQRVEKEGFMHVRAAITAIKEEDSLSSILKRSINFEGDTDTVATIALAAASVSSEIIQELPPVLVENLENGEYGRAYLINLDKKLRKRFSQNI
jgi:ADP-ribosyl-[dinitrogen reductase] hydrolase